MVIPEKPRSIDQHRRLFALIKAAHDHWPEAHSFQADNAEHMRAWLLVKAKHRTVKTFYLSEDASESARLIPFVIASMLGKYAWAWADGNTLRVCVPDTIAFDKCPHGLFCGICDAVADVILREAGLKSEDLLTEVA